MHPRRRITIALIALIASPLIALFAPAHVSADTNPDPEQQTIQRSSASPSNDSPTNAQPAAPPAGQGYDPVRVTLALGAVIGLIFALRWGAKKLYPGAMPVRGAASVRVLSRTPIGHRQQVVLLKVGRRILAVGDSAARLSPLCEITDPDEVAALLGAARSNREAAEIEPDEPPTRAPESPRNESPRNPFAPIMDSAARVYDPAPAAAINDIDDTAPAGEDDPALAATREQLTGLSQRVRLLARQFAQQ